MKIKNYKWCEKHKENCAHAYCFWCRVWWCEIYYNGHCPSISHPDEKVEKIKIDLQNAVNDQKANDEAV